MVVFLRIQKYLLILVTNRFRLIDVRLLVNSQLYFYVYLVSSEQIHK